PREDEFVVGLFNGGQDIDNLKTQLVLGRFHQVAGDSDLEAGGVDEEIPQQRLGEGEAHGSSGEAVSIVDFAGETVGQAVRAEAVDARAELFQFTDRVGGQDQVGGGQVGHEEEGTADLAVTVIAGEAEERVVTGLGQLQIQPRD